MSDTKLIALAKRFGELSEAESRMLESVATGKEAFCGESNDRDHPSNHAGFSEPASAAAPWRKDREIRAEVIRWLCTSEDTKKLLDPSGIQVFGARIVNPLNLDYVKIPVPIALKHCRLIKPASFHASTLKALDMEGSWTQALDIASATVNDYLALSGGFHAEGQVDLSRTRIAHDLNLSSAFVTNPSGYAIRGDGCSVGGYVFLIPDPSMEKGRFSFCAIGTVLLTGAAIGGDLDCTGAQFHNHGKE